MSNKTFPIEKNVDKVTFKQESLSGEDAPCSLRFVKISIHLNLF